MGSGGATPLASATLYASRVQYQPLRPVPAKIKKIVKVNETALFQVVDQSRKRIVRREGTYQHKSVLDSKLVRRKVIPFIDDSTRYPARLECALTNQHYGTILRQLERHIYVRLETN